MPDTWIGKVVGNIRIIDRLARGGTGQVYVGRDEKLGRKVALKAIRSRYRLDQEAKARLLREARILSRLDHPHISRIYDFVTSDGTDFLVLELIPGSNLREHLREGMAEELKMKVALQVAGVLEAAHGQGVIHRDLKPENVMITPEGDVKVLDFGLARNFDEEIAATLSGAELGDYEDLATGRTPMPEDLKTRLGRVLGTVGYMSPEQARGQPVTAASDMYSLGLMLQEMFTGKRPYELNLSRVEVLKRAAQAETRPVEGIAPDLKELIESLKSLAPMTRPSAAETLERLRWIVAGPRRRRRRWLTAAAMVLLAAVAIVTSALAWRLAREVERANQQAERANREAAAARQVTDFLVDIFEVSDPGRARGNSITAREILDFGAEKAGRELADQPLTQARVMHTVGALYQELGLYQQASPLVLKALQIRDQHLGPAHLDIAASLYELAYLYWRQGELEQAKPLYERAIAIQEELLEPDHPELAASLNGLAIVYWNEGDYERAEPLYRRSLAIREQALGPGHPEVAASLENLAILLKDRGRESEAEPYYQRSLEIRELSLGPEHHLVATSLNNLAELYKQQQRWPEAVARLEQAVAIWEGNFGPDHPAVAVGLNNLAEAYAAEGDRGRAEPLYERALRIMTSALGPEHPYVGYALQGLGKLHSAAGELDEATALLDRSLTIFEQSLGEEHPDAGRCRRDLALAYNGLGETDRAESQFRRALFILERSSRTDDAEVLSSIDGFAASLASAGRPEAAARWQAEARSRQGAAPAG